MQELLQRIRSVTEEDKDLPVFSYSKLDTFRNCPMQYRLKYVEKKRPEDDTSLALELGSLCHAILERKGLALVSGGTVDYDALNESLLNGVTDTNEKTKESLPGIKQLKRKYFDEWYVSDNASGATYEDKMKMFDKVLHSEMEGSEWVPTYFEKSFEFVWDNRAIIKGFIDRIDTKHGQYKTIDYKTSKKVFDQSKLSTSLQFGIYALAILKEFGQLPVESEYRFILIDDSQYALTKGWEKRLTKALDKLLDDIEGNENKKVFAPKPTPLCYYCDYCVNNSRATVYRQECDYYSLWTPTQKTFEVNRKWDGSTANGQNNIQTKRRLIF